MAVRRVAGREGRGRMIGRETPPFANPAPAGVSERSESFSRLDAFPFHTVCFAAVWPRMSTCRGCYFAAFPHGKPLGPRSIACGRFVGVCYPACGLKNLVSTSCARALSPISARILLWWRCGYRERGKTVAPMIRYRPGGKITGADCQGLPPLL